MDRVLPTATLTAPQAANPARARVALLIDGENIAASAAGKIVAQAAKFGDLTIRRVYGNAAALGDWHQTAGLRIVHSGSGKNATDLLMTVEAMSFLLGAEAEVLALASSDRDFGHLVTHLRERSIPVVGLGDARAPEAFRKSCSSFHELPGPASQKPGATGRKAPTTRNLDTMIRSLIRNEGEGGSFPIASLGQRIHALHGIKISDTPEKSWRAYLLARSEQFQCDPRGPAARVRLRA